MGVFDDDDWGTVVEGSGDYARVQQLENHLIIVFPIGYIDHHPTRFTTPGKKSDVIVCDVIDLDDVDEQGNQGKVYRTAWWRSAQLIMNLRPLIGRRVLGRIGKGIPRNGMNPPWVINDATGEPGAMDRAQAWGQAHSNFVLSTFSPPAAVAPTPPPAYNAAPAQSGYQAPPQGYSNQQYQDQGYGAQQSYVPPPQQPQPQYQQPPQYPQQRQPNPQNYPPQQQGYPPQQQGGYNNGQQLPAYQVPQSQPSQPDQLDLMRAERMRREAPPPQQGNQWQNDEPPF